MNAIVLAALALAAGSSVKAELLRLGLFHGDEVQARSSRIRRARGQGRSPSLRRLLIECPHVPKHQDPAQLPAAGHG